MFNARDGSSECLGVPRGSSGEGGRILRGTEEPRNRGTEEPGGTPRHSEALNRMTDKTTPEDAPPILGSWRNLYTAVLLALAAEVVLFYLFTRSFA
jgi:hypothetical protein